MQQISYEYEGFPEFLRSEDACKRAVNLGRLGPDTPIVVYEEGGDRSRIPAREHPVLRSLLGLDVVAEPAPLEPQTAAPAKLAEWHPAESPATLSVARSRLVSSLRAPAMPVRADDRQGLAVPGQSAPIVQPTTAFEWMTLAVRRAVDFQGRSGRKEYWMFTLLVLLSYVAALVVVGISDKLGATLIVLIALAALVPGLAVAVRRFHDLGLTGWCVLISLIPYVGGVIFLILMMVEGKREANQYGPSPKFGPDLAVLEG